MATIPGGAGDEGADSATAVSGDPATALSHDGVVEAAGRNEPKHSAEPLPDAEVPAGPWWRSRLRHLSDEDAAALWPFLGEPGQIRGTPYDKPVYEYVRVTYDDGSTGHRLAARRRAYFARDDGRLFWVTFGATVAGTVASVMIVAVAVILAKSGIARIMGKLDAGAVIAAIFIMAFGAALSATQIYFLRQRTETNRYARFSSLFVVCTYGVGAVLIALTLLGYAVGIR